AQNVMPLSIAGGIPTRNLQSASFEGAESISGEAFAEELLRRKITCSGCPVGCVHIGLLREEFAQGYEYKYTGVGYDYELIFALGSMLGVADKKGVLQLIEKVEGHGLDAMSTGVALAWLTEAKEKGLFTGEDLQANVEFGNTQEYLKAIDHLVYGKTPVYQALAKGVDHAAKAYGGEDFACTLGKNEMAGYHTGYGSVLGQTYGSRHSHLDNGGYSFDQKKNLDLEKLVDGLIVEEAERDMLTSLSICLFARKIYDDRLLVSRCLDALGIKQSPEELGALGQKIFALKHALKQRLGFNLSEVTVPKRFLQTKALAGQLDPEVLEKLSKAYQAKLRAIAAEQSLV
ncbi:MAG: aldehyde ferredoxin oxidoreductase C-terminal domain-containing protein, partial [Bacteroidota bacterium]